MLQKGAIPIRHKTCKRGVAENTRFAPSSHENYQRTSHLSVRTISHGYDAAATISPPTLSDHIHPCAQHKHPFQENVSRPPRACHIPFTCSSPLNDRKRRSPGQASPGVQVTEHQDTSAPVMVVHKLLHVWLCKSPLHHVREMFPACGVLKPAWEPEWFVPSSRHQHTRSLPWNSLLETSMYFSCSRGYKNGN